MGSWASLVEPEPAVAVVEELLARVVVQSLPAMAAIVYQAAVTVTADANAAVTRNVSSGGGVNTTQSGVECAGCTFSPVTFRPPHLF